MSVIWPATGDPALDPATHAAVEEAVAALLGGGVIVLPTDTLYGVAARAADGDAVAALFALKERPDRQPLAVLVADADQALDLLDAPSAALRAVMQACWPGALTLVARRSEAHRHLDLGGESSTIGVRCPASPVARAVAAAVGPIATTSANRHKQPTPHDAEAAAASLAGAVALVLDGGPCREQASTVVDATGGEWVVLREGPVGLDAIIAAGGPTPR